MPLPPTPAPNPLASPTDELRQTVHDAAEVAKGYASEARSVARSAAESVRPAIDDAAALADQARGTVAGLFNDVVDIATDTLANGRQRCSDAIARNPYQAMLVFAGLGALVALCVRASLTPRPRPPAP